MEKKNKERNYTTVSIPKTLINIVDDVVQSGKYGYRSRSDLILEAIRNLLREYGVYKPPEEEVEPKLLTSQKKEVK